MLLVIGCSLWAIPRRVHQVVLVDGTQQWTQQSAPPQRKITWRQAEPLTPSVIDAAIPESLVRPQFAEGGLALYYTLRQPGGEADIYRSQFDGKQWLAGEPVENLNLPAGDYGPVISTDGSTLYLYSDRPGGYGGYDLFVSRRTPAGWSEPENMGPLFNSPAHEYDPAISPDGKRLFFASNRTTTMENRLAIAADQGATVVPWRATLRAEVALQQFDLYVSELDGARAEWTAAVNFQAVNTLTANEGEPFVSPDGAFLYFTSDRTNPHGAARNYDIYRVRLRQAGIAPVENIGSGINTSANEHDPALSPEGFRIVFSSDRAGDSKHSPDLYSLYASQATETFAETTWSTAHAAPLAGHWWWLFLAVIVLGLMAAVLYYLRERSLRRAPLPAFFLVALCLHMLLLTGAFFVPIEGVTIAQRIKQQIEKIVATNVQLESSPAQVADPAAFEKIADLQSLASAEVTSEPRQAVENPTLPLPTPVPTVTISKLLNREQLNGSVVAIGPVIVLEQETPQVIRRQESLEQVQAEIEVAIAPAQQVSFAPVEIALTIAEVTTQKVAPKRLEVIAPEVRREAVTPAIPRADLEGNRQQAAISSPNTVANAVDASSLARQNRAGNIDTTAPSETIATDALSKAAFTAVKGDAPSAPSVEVELARKAGGATIDFTRSTVASASGDRRSSTLVADVEAKALPAAAAARPAAASAALSRTAATAPVEFAETGAIVPMEISRLSPDKSPRLPSEDDNNLRPEGVEVVRTSAAASGAIANKSLAEAIGRSELRPASLKAGDIGGRAELTAATFSTPTVVAPVRQRSRATSLLYAQDTIGLQQMLRERQGDDAKKQDLIDAFGGQAGTLEAIQRGLHWLALVQLEDGHWSLKQFKAGPAGEAYSGQGNEQSDTAATGLALLPFLGDGHTHTSGRYRAMVGKGLEWIVKQQKPDGDLFVGQPSNAYLYSHGIATISLCEAFGMTKDEALMGPAQRAIDFIVKSQHADGGWRYRPGEPGDTSVMGWQLMALKSGQMAGLTVPGETLEKARNWLEKCRCGPDGREFAYVPGGAGNPAMTAEGLLCMEYLGSKIDAPEVRKNIDFLLEHLPAKGQDTSYSCYYGTQALFHVQGEPWRKWNSAMSDLVLTTQVIDGPHRGTWDPGDQWEAAGGRIYATSLRLLMLEVYFRHLPLYQVLQ